MTTPDRPDVTALRDALLENITGEWDCDPYGEYEAAHKRLSNDLDALIAAVRADATRAAECVCPEVEVERCDFTACRFCHPFTEGDAVPPGEPCAAEAEVAGLRAALDALSTHAEHGHGCVEWRCDEQAVARAALAAQPAAPEAETERCAVCGHEPHDSALGCTFESSVEPDWFCACQHPAPR